MTHLAPAPGLPLSHSCHCCSGLQTQRNTQIVHHNILVADPQRVNTASNQVCTGHEANLTQSTSRAHPFCKIHFNVLLPLAVLYFKWMFLIASLPQHCRHLSSLLSCPHNQTITASLTVLGYLSKVQCCHYV